MTLRERHEHTAAAVRDCLCRGNPQRLCPDYLRGSLRCCRPEGHEGAHVACAGADGPHAIASWER